MMNSSGLVTEFAVASGSGFAIATSVNAEPLLTALITLGTTIVTMVGGELVKFLVAYLKKKTNDLKEGEGEKQDENKK